MSTAVSAIMGPHLRAIPVPVVGTYADGTELPSTLLMNHAKSSSPEPGTIRARRDAGYLPHAFGTAQAGTTTNRLFLDTDAYSGTDGLNKYSGKGARIYSGTGVGQDVTLTYITGREYSVSPTWAAVPGDKYEIDYFNWSPGYISEGVGQWTYGEQNIQSTVWCDGSKRGILVLLTYALNRQHYGPGGPHYENSRYRMLVYNPDDLGSDAALTGAVDKTSDWDFDLPGITFPMGKDANKSRFANMTIDQAKRKLYVVDPIGWQSSAFSSNPVFIVLAGGQS